MSEELYQATLREISRQKRQARNEEVRAYFNDLLDDVKRWKAAGEDWRGKLAQALDSSPPEALESALQLLETLEQFGGAEAQAAPPDEQERPEQEKEQKPLPALDSGQSVETRAETLEQRRDSARRREESAEAHLPLSPERALELLREARNYLTEEEPIFGEDGKPLEPVLTDEDKAIFKPDVERLEGKIAAIQAEAEKKQRAVLLIEAARNAELSPAERLARLQTAQSAWEHAPKLRAYQDAWQHARGALARQAAGKLDALISRAQLLGETEADFEQKIEALQEELNALRAQYGGLLAEKPDLKEKVGEVEAQITALQYARENLERGEERPEAAQPSRPGVEPAPPVPEETPTHSLEAGEELTIERYLQEGQYPEALRELDALIERVPDSARRQALEQRREEIEEQYRRTVQTRLAEARKVAEQHPDDLRKQREAWESVLSLNPEHPEALAAKQALESRLRLEETLEGAIRRAREALEKRNVKAMREALEEMRKVGLDTFADEAVKAKVARAEEQWSPQYNHLREKLGQVTTLETEQRYREAYASILEEIRRDTPFIIDAATGEEIRPEDKLPEIRSKFLEGLRGILQRREEAADENLPLYPERALELLREARNYLTEEEPLFSQKGEPLKPVLTDENKAIFKPDVERLEKKIAAIQAEAEKKQRAVLLIEAALNVELSPAERLGKLQTAQSAWEHAPKLRAYQDAWQHAQNALVRQAAGTLDALMRRARLLDETEADFEQKIEALQEELNALRAQYGGLLDEKPDLKEKADTVVERLDALREARKEFERVQQKLAETQSELEDAEPDDEHVKIAETLLRKIPGKYQDMIEYIRLEARLNRLQGSQKQWNSGLTAYRQRKWNLARENLQQIPAGEEGSYPDLPAYLDRLAAIEHVLAGERALQERRWIEAREAFDAAHALFESSGTDEQTRTFAQRAAQGRERLQVMEQNDAQASQDVQRLRSMLSTPDELADLLHLIDGWQVVVNWRERPTRLAVELGELEDSLKKKILASWQAQLAQALQEADFPRLQALKEALTRMRNMGIFPEERSEYREHARQLQAALLDLAFEQLSRSDDFSKMLENRQQRLRLCRQQDERQKVQGEIRAVHRRRALMELHRASSAESDIAPLFWQYIRSPELGKDAELVEGFIRQALANSALDKILAVAKGFQWMGASDMWWDALKELLTGFYQAASKLEAGELSLARAELDHTRNALQGTPQLRTLLESMWEQLIDSRVDNLFREADNARRALPRVLALTRIAKLRPDDPRLRVRFHGRGHLQELEDEVTQELERLKKQPLRFVDGPYLRKTIEDMERTTQDLDDLLQSEVLQTGDARYWREDLQEENRLVKDVVSKLRILNRRYQEYKKLLEDATHTPIFEAGKGYQWNLNPVRTALEHIQRLVNEIRGIRGFDIQVLSHEIQTLREDFERRKEYASKLNKLINDLMEYLRQEQIDAAYNTVLALEHAWDAARSHEFDGLHFALEYQYPSSSETVSTIQGHKKQLEAISTNLALWQDLQDAMNKKYEELMEMAQDLGETLDEAREFYSLNEIIKKSEEILQSIEKFQRNYKPQSISPPRSEQARSCKNAIEALVSQSKNLYSRYQRMRDDSDSLLKENSEKRERLKKVTQNLRRALREAEKPRSFLSRRNKKSISSIAIDNVQKALSEYEKIDPKSPVVTEARELLSKAEQP